jgi:hypothetical protein
MKHRFRRFVPSPIWALFVPPLFGRFFLLARTMIGTDSLAEGIYYELNVVLWVTLVILTGYVASRLAVKAGLSERGHERFTVMAMLSAITPPIGIAVAEFSGTVHLIVSQLLLLGLLLYIFQLLPVWKRKQLDRPDRPGFIMQTRRIHPIFIRLYKLISLPLLLCGTLAIISQFALMFGGTTSAQTGFIAALAIAIPFCIAASFTLPYMITQQQRIQRQEEQNRREQDSITTASQKPTRGVVILHIAFLAVIGLYFGGQIYSYIFLPLV